MPLEATRSWLYARGMLRRSAQPAQLRVWLVVLLLTPLKLGCWVDTAPPAGGGGECNTDGTCAEGETCLNCPADCSRFCCAARSAGQQGVGNPAGALGKADNAVATLRGEATLELFFDEDIPDGADEDLEVVGQVAAGPEGGIVVYAWDSASADLDRWEVIGEWADNSTTGRRFDLNRAQSGAFSVNRLRLRGRPGTQAQVDAVLILNCSR